MSSLDYRYSKRRHLPASIWGFFTEASSGVSAALKTTGPLDIEPPGFVEVESSRFAYNERPEPRCRGLGVEEFDIIVGL